MKFTGYMYSLKECIYILEFCFNCSTSMTQKQLWLEHKETKETKQTRRRRRRRQDKAREIECVKFSVSVKFSCKKDTRLEEIKREGSS